MFGLKKIVASVVAIGALAVPSLALADDHTPRDVRGDHATIQHREDRDRRGDWQRDHRDWRDRYGRYDRDGRDGHGWRGGHGDHCRR